MSSTVTALDPASAGEYLIEREVLAPAGDPIHAEELGGGISNVVLRVSQGEGSLIVKQPLERMRTAAEWHFGRGRVLAEHHCLSAVRDLLGEAAAPEPLFMDEEKLILGMEDVAGTTTWKDELLAGRVSINVTREVGRMLGELQSGAARSRALAERFHETRFMREGRIDPYHRTIAERHPELRAVIEADVARLESTRETLVLGDLSPKNVLLAGERTTLIDFEVAHWGDPAFDPAFCLTHLLLKAIHLPGASAELLSAAETFLDAYLQSAPGGDAEARLRAIGRELACLMLARVDGKSPAEYLDDGERSLVRALAVSLLQAEPVAPSAIFSRVAQAVPGPPT